MATSPLSDFYATMAPPKRPPAAFLRTSSALAANLPEVGYSTTSLAMPTKPTPQRDSNNQTAIDAKMESWTAAFANSDATTTPEEVREWLFEWFAVNYIFLDTDPTTPSTVHAYLARLNLTFSQLTTIPAAELAKYLHSKSAYLGFDLVSLIDKLAADVQDAKRDAVEVRALRAIEEEKEEREEREKNGKRTDFSFTVEGTRRFAPVRGDPSYVRQPWDHEDQESVLERLGKWGKGVLGISGNADSNAGVEEDEGQQGGVGEGKGER